MNIKTKINISITLVSIIAALMSFFIYYEFVYDRDPIKNFRYVKMSPDGKVSRDDYLKIYYSYDVVRDCKAVTIYESFYRLEDGQYREFKKDIKGRSEHNNKTGPANYFIMTKVDDWTAGHWTYSARIHYHCTGNPFHSEEYVEFPDLNFEVTNE